MLYQYLGKTIIIKSKDIFTTFHAIGELKKAEKKDHFILDTISGSFEFSPEKIKKVKFVGDNSIPCLYLKLKDCRE